MRERERETDVDDSYNHRWKCIIKLGSNVIVPSVHSVINVEVGAASFGGFWNEIPMN